MADSLSEFENISKLYKFGCNLHEEFKICLSESCNLNYCDAKKEKECIWLFKNDSCVEGDLCKLDEIKSCTFCDLSDPINFEANTGFIGPSATESWNRLEAAVNNVYFLY